MIQNMLQSIDKQDATEAAPESLPKQIDDIYDSDLLTKPDHVL
jgi:hypothetical protein